MPLLYAVVARDKTVLAECALAKGNFPAISRKVFEKLPTQDAQESRGFEEQLISYKVKDGITFLCISDRNFKVSASQLFLDRLAKNFLATYSNTMMIAGEYSMNKDFGPVMEKYMNAVNSGAVSTTVDQIMAKQKQTKDALSDTIDSILARGDLLESITNRTDNLDDTTALFKQEAKGFKRRLCCQKWRLTLFIILLVIVLLAVIVIFACGGFLLPNCIPQPAPEPPHNNTLLYFPLDNEIPY